jgi:hypothetical protein
VIPGRVGVVPRGWRLLANGEIRGDEDMYQDSEGSWHWCEISQGREQGTPNATEPCVRRVVGESHEEYAQRVYGIDPKDLTKEQRAAVKAERFVSLYSLNSRGLSKLRGMFDVAKLDFAAAEARFAAHEVSLNRGEN